MMYSFLAQVPDNVEKEMEMHAFVLFKDLDFKRFTDKIVKKLESMHGYKTEENYDSLAKDAAEKSKYGNPKLREVYRQLVKGNLQKFDMEFEEYINSLPVKLPEELKKDKEVMSKLENIRIPDRDGLLEERYIRYLLKKLAMSLMITALKMTKNGKKYIQKELEHEETASFDFNNFLSMYYLDEKSDALKKYLARCCFVSITKDDVRRLGKELSVYSPHKIGWLS